MDRSAAPWRVLEDAEPPPAGGDASSGGAVAGAVRPAGRRIAGLSIATVAGVGVAGLLAVAAFAVAVSAPRGSVVVDAAAPDPSGRPEGSGLAAGRASGSGSELVVDVQGAVLEPGVRTLPVGSRVADAIQAAGGYGPRVDAIRAGRDLNLAAELKDGDRVVVPSRDDPPAAPGPPAAGGAGAAGSGTDAGPIDLNTATAAQLDELPGVGPVTAQKIIDARAEQPFTTVDDLRERKIVGAATFEKLRDLVTVG